MGFIVSKKSSKQFNYGAEVEGIYGKIENLFYDAQQEVWQAQMVFFINKAAGERVKLIKYLRDTMLDFDKPNESSPLKFAFKPRDSNKYSIKEWELMQSTALSLFPTPIYSYTYGIHVAIIGPIELSRDSILPKIYSDFTQQCEPEAEPIIVDRPMEGIDGILTELLLQAQESNSVTPNPITNIVSG